MQCRVWVIFLRNMRHCTCNGCVLDAKRTSWNHVICCCHLRILKMTEEIPSGFQFEVNWPLPIVITLAQRQTGSISFESNWIRVWLLFRCCLMFFQLCEFDDCVGWVCSYLDYVYSGCRTGMALP